MQPIAHTSGLGVLSNTDLSEILNSPIEESCPVMSQETSLLKVAKLSSTHKNENFSPKLQIRGDFLVEYETHTSSIVGGFRFDYEIKFEVVENSPSIEGERKKPKQEQNQYVILSFRFPEPQTHHVNFLIKKSPVFDSFLKRLQRKYISQLNFHGLFQPIRKIGKGVTANVYKASRIKDGKHVAIKSFKKQLSAEEENAIGKLAFLKQLKVLTEIKHPNLCQFLGVYDSNNSSYIVMQLLGNSLFLYLQKVGFPSPKKTKMMIQQLIKGVHHLHLKGIMHRDLKLQNIMVKNETNEKIEVVIVDLGLAEYVSNEKYIYTRCGTPGYVAPEILQKQNNEQRYTQTCDMFSLGVIFHILLFKRSLFEGTDVKQVIKKNTECQIDQKAQYLEKQSPQALNLLFRMLEKDPNKRISAAQALSHEYFAELNKESMSIEKTSPKIELPA